LDSSKAIHRSGCSAASAARSKSDSRSFPQQTPSRSRAANRVVVVFPNEPVTPTTPPRHRSKQASGYVTDRSRRAARPAFAGCRNHETGRSTAAADPMPSR
jgi:hypothetical protein